MKSTLTRALTIIAFLFSSTSTVAIAQNSPQKLSITGILKLVVSQSGNQITISSVPEAGNDDANGFEVKEKNGVLVIESDIIDGTKTYSFNMNNLSEIHVDGITHVSFRNVLQFGYMKFKIDGIIDGPINVNADYVDIDTKGISELYIEGRTQHVNIKADGISTICAKNLIAQTGFVESLGINDVWVNVMQHLNVKIDGIGNVYFKNYNWSDVLTQRQPRLYSELKGISHVKLWQDNGKNECNDKGTLINKDIKKVENPKDMPPTKKSKGKRYNDNTEVTIGKEVDVKVEGNQDEDLPEPKPVPLPKQDTPSKGGKVKINNGNVNVNTNDANVNVNGGNVDVNVPGTNVNAGTNGVDVNTPGTNVNVGTNGTRVKTKSGSSKKARGKKR
jgi:hypothetical protein